MARARAAALGLPPPSPSQFGAEAYALTRAIFRRSTRFPPALDDSDRVLTSPFLFTSPAQMDPKFLRNQKYSKRGNKVAKK